MNIFTGEDGNNEWPDVLKFLYECCNSSENVMKEVALHIIMYVFLHIR